MSFTFDMEFRNAIKIINTFIEEYVSNGGNVYIIQKDETRSCVKVNYPIDIFGYIKLSEKDV